MGTLLKQPQYQICSDCAGSCTAQLAAQQAMLQQAARSRVPVRHASWAAGGSARTGAGQRLLSGAAEGTPASPSRLAAAVAAAATAAVECTAAAAVAGIAAAACPPCWHAWASAPLQAQIRSVRQSTDCAPTQAVACCTVPCLQANCAGDQVLCSELRERPCGGRLLEA